MKVDDLEITPHVLIAMCTDSYQLGVSYAVQYMLKRVPGLRLSDDLLLRWVNGIMAETLEDEGYRKRWIHYLLKIGSEARVAE